MKTFEIDIHRPSALLLPAVLCAVTLGLGCGPPGGEPTESQAREAQEMNETVTDAAAHSRELVEQARQTIEQADDDIADARRKLDELPAESSEALSQAIARTETARRALDAELEALDEAGEERWASARDRVSNAITEIDEARREIAAAVADSEDGNTT